MTPFAGPVPEIPGPAAESGAGSGDPGRPPDWEEREMATETAPPGTGVSAGAVPAGGATATPSPTEHLELADRVWLLRAMLLMRGLEERAMTLYRQGKVPGSFYDGYGQEAVSAGAAFAMAPEDRLCILHRDLAAHIIRGVGPVRILSQYMGRAAGITR